jgi:hypothetical protein
MTGPDAGMAPQKTARLRGRVFPVIGYGVVFVIALAALAGAFWTWREGHANRREIGRLAIAVGRLDARLRTMSRRMVARDEWVRLKARLVKDRARVAALGQRLGTLEGRVATNREQAALRGAGLLLTIGARLAALEPDARWMRGVLITVRGLLAPWPSPRLVPLRRLLTADIRRLGAPTREEGLRPGRVLAALARAAPDWPLLAPRPPPPTSQRPPRAHGFWNRFEGRIARLFRSLVRIRTLPGRTPPPPGPREAARIRLGLALNLTLARINWLSGRRRQYQMDLKLLHRLILRHYETRNPAVMKALSELVAIRKPPTLFHWTPLLDALHALRGPASSARSSS